LREASSPELRVVRVSEFVEGVVLVLSPWLWRKFSSDLWAVVVSSRVRAAESVLGMRGKGMLWVLT
jgi:hypothetical protein